MIETLYDAFERTDEVVKDPERTEQTIRALQAEIHQMFEDFRIDPGSHGFLIDRLERSIPVREHAQV